MSHKLSKALAVVAITGGLAGFGAAAATTVASAATPPGTCTQYSYSGSWNVDQSGLPLVFQLTQTGTAITGNASYNGGSGPISGTLVGNTFDVFVTWSASSVGEYTATVTPTSMSGTTHDTMVQNGPVVNWTATGTASCTSATATPTSKDQCKNGGWQNSNLVDASGNPFKNQGDCVSFVASGGKSDPSHS